MLNPISNGYTIPKGFIFAKFAGNDYFEELGDTDNVEINVEVERDERYDNRFGTRRVSDSQVTSIKVTFATTLVQMTNRNRALAVMGSKGALTQTAATAVVKTYTVTTEMLGKAFDLGGIDLTMTSVTDGATTPVPKVLGTDYAIDTAAGMWQPLTEGVFKFTFDKPAITSATDRLKTGIGGNPDIEAELIIRGTNDSGPKALVRVWKARLTPSKARGYISESERGSIELNGDILADAVRGAAEGDATEYAFGYETTLAA